MGSWEGSSPLTPDVCQEEHWCQLGATQNPQPRGIKEVWGEVDLFRGVVEFAVSFGGVRDGEFAVSLQVNALLVEPQLLV